MELKELFERSVEIRQAIPTPSVKQRLAQAAQELSLAGSNQARVELLNESVMAITKILYDTDPDGHLPNIDSYTHRIIIAKPWGKGGHTKWGLRDWEATVLRRILILRSEMRRVQPVFDYAPDSKQWYLNYASYTRLDMALMYWKSNPIALKDYRLFADAQRQQARERMDRLRGKD